jgi:hypothetical protein
VWALEQPHEPRAEPLVAGTPLGLLIALFAGGAVVLAVAGESRSAAAVVAVAIGHGALVATAIGWASHDDGRGGAAVQGAIVVGLLALAAALARLGPVAALAYLAPAGSIAVWSARGRLRTLGLGVPVSARALAAGAVVGAVLGGHLLVSASRTLGYRPHTELMAMVAALGYDAGANVLAAEVFFRGALFNRAQRRWSLGAAAALSTAAYVARYLVDPLLPPTLEIVIGAAFYLTVLSLANCWLLWRSGSLLPGMVAGLAFFTAYRLLGAR